jgi:acylphosphatase
MIVSGRVQGVGYRVACAREASRLGVVGQVRNLHDGSVEVLATASPDVLTAFTVWCRRGPWAAEVRDLTFVDEPLAEDSVTERGFRVV